jgi:WD40 repeat protein/tetratricopeptide (TPR) repeat protein
LAYRRNRTVAHLLAVFLVLAVAGVVQYIVAIRREQGRTEAQAREVTRRLDRQYVAEGVRRWGDGDWLGSLPWLTEALTLAEPGSRRAQAHRIRLGMLQALSPRPVRAWFLGGGVNDLAFSPDGRRLAAAGQDRTAQIWDVVTGQPAAPPLAHDDPVLQVVFSPDGRRLLTVSGDLSGRNGPGEARVWDAATGTPIARLKHRDKPEGARPGPAPATDYVIRHVGLVLRAAFRPDGKAVVTASDDQTARLWDAATGQAIGRPMEHGDNVRDVAFRPDGGVLATGSDDHTICLWDTATATSRREPLKLERAVDQIAFSPDGAHFAAVAGREIHLRDRAHPQGRTLTPQEGGYRLRIAFSPDSRRLAAVGDEGVARLWDLEANRWLPARMPHPGAMAVAFAPEGRRLLTIGGGVRLWDVPTGRPVGPSLPMAGDHAAISPDGLRLAVARGETVTLWELPPAGPLVVPPAPGATDSLVTASRDGRRVLVVSNRRVHGAPGEVGEARVWDVDRAVVLSPPLRHDLPIGRATFSPDGRLVATAAGGSGSGGRGEANQPGEARIWDATTGRPMTPPLRHEGPVRFVAFSPDASRLATCGDDGRLRLWEAETGRMIAEAAEPAAPLRLAVFDSDGRSVLVIAGSDEPGSRGSARLWDVATARPRSTPLLHDGVILRAWLSPDAHRALTVCRRWEGGRVPTSARLWDTEAGRLLTGPIAAQDDDEPRFSPDGKVLLFGGRLYDASSGVAVRELGGKLVDAGWPAEGPARIVTAEGSQVRVRDLATGEPVIPGLDLPGELAAARLSPDGHWLATVTRLPQRPTGEESGELRIWDATTGEPMTPALPFEAGPADPPELRYTPGGTRLIALRRKYNQWSMWALDLAADERPSAALSAMAQRGSGHRIDATGGIVPVDPRATWAEAGAAPSGPGDAESLGREAAWYRREALEGLGVSEFPAALWSLDRLATRGGLTPDERAWRATALAHEERWAEAAEAYAGMTDATGSASWAWQGRAEALAHLHRWEDAIAAYTRAIDLGQADERAWLGRAIARAEAGQADAARRDLEESVSTYAHTLIEQTLGRQVHRLEEEEAWAGAICLLDELLKIPFLSGFAGSFRRPDALAHRGHAHQQLGRHEAAVADFTKALDLQPQAAWFWRGRSRSLAALGRREQAEADARQAEKLEAAAQEAKPGGVP